jgi:hypothetical protein
MHPIQFVATSWRCPIPSSLLNARRLLLLFLSQGLLVTCGCQFVHTREKPFEQNIDRPKATQLKTIAVEVLFLRFPEQDSLSRDELWNLVDEQTILPETRAKWSSNGLRLGVVTTKLPNALANRFIPEHVHSGEDVADGSLSATPAVVRRVLRLLPGKRSDLVICTGVPEMILLEHDAGGVHGATYRDASGYVSLRAWPDADGHVKIELVPAIAHGSSQRSWIGDNGVFRLETGQPRIELTTLLCNAIIPIDSMVVISCAGDATSSVGGVLFRERMSGKSELRMIAIRPLSRSCDPAFSSQDLFENDSHDASAGFDDRPHRVNTRQETADFESTIEPVLSSEAP